MSGDDFILIVKIIFEKYIKEEKNIICFSPLLCVPYFEGSLQNTIINELD
jgi:hypothetical protein